MNVNEPSLSKKEFNSFGGTLNEIDDPTEILDDQVSFCENWKVHPDGKSRIKRMGCTKVDSYYSFGGKPVRGLFDFWDENGYQRYVVVLSNEVWLSDVGMSGWTMIYSQTNQLSGPVKLVSYNRERPILVGMDTNLIIEPSGAVLLGIEAPTTAITVAEEIPAGALISEKLTDGDMEVWGSATDLTNYTELILGTSTVNRDSTDKHEGTYSCRFDVDSSNSVAVITQSVALSIGKKNRLVFWYKNEIAGKTSAIAITDAGMNTWLQQDGTWASGEHYVSLPSSTDWAEYVIEFDTNPTYPNVNLSFCRADSASSKCWFDEASLMEYDEDVIADTITGTFKYAVTYYRSGNYPCESNPSPVSAEIEVDRKYVSLTAIPVSADPKVDTKRLYRTTDGGALLYWLADITNATTTYQDKLEGLGDELSYDRYIPDPASFAEIWDERLWYIPKDYPNQLHFTNTGTSEEMSEDNIIQVKGKDSDTLVGLQSFGDSLYAFKRKSWFRINKIGNSDFEMIEMPIKSGLDAACSIGVGGSLMIWKSKFGIEVWNGQTLFRPPISRSIQKTIDSINKGANDKCFGLVNDAEDEYWLAVPTGNNTEPDTVIVFNHIIGSLHLYKFPWPITAMHNIRDGSSNPTFITGTFEGDVHAQGSGYTDDGEKIESLWKTKVWRGATGEKAVWNNLRRLMVEYNLPAGRTLLLHIYANLDSHPVATARLEGFTPTHPDGLTRILRRIDLGVRSAYYCFGFENNEDVGGECRVSGFDGYFKRKFWKKDVEAGYYARSYHG